MKQKVLALFLAVVMAVSLLPMSALAAGSIVDSGTCGANGDNLTWTLDDSGTLTISGTGKMKNYVHYSDSPWYSHHETIKTVIISDGVTSIGASAFVYCSSLTSITIPNSVTSIGEDAFYFCDSLTDITIPSNVTSIGDGTFARCSSLMNIDIPSNVTSIGISAFLECSSLTGITIPNSVTSIGKYAFAECSSLTDITIPNSVTYIREYTFAECSNLTNVTIPNSVTSIGNSAFYGCSSLVSVSISNSVTSIGDITFADCSSLTDITIPNSVTSIGQEAFSGCSSLTDITIPNSITSIVNSAFYNCSSLTEISIPNSVTYIDWGVFRGCSSLTSISVNPENSFYSSIDGVLFNKEQSILIQYPAGKTNPSYTIPDSVTSMEDSAFYGCSSLTSVSIPNNVTSIEDSTFRECSSLDSIFIPNSVTSIGLATFYDCSSLSDVYYMGSKEQWDKIKIGSDNDPLLNATIHYNQDSIPETYTVTYTDGVNNAEVFKDQVHKDLTAGTNPPQFNGTPTREGYTFKGWSPAVADTVTKSVTYTAQWEQNLYTVTYTDGVDNAEFFKDQVNQDLTFGAKTPQFNGTPTREGYTFKGWSPAVADTVTKSVTYTAQWEQNLYSVTYTDGVDNAEVFKDQVHKDLTNGTKTPAFNGTPTREGYTFKGWSPAVADTVTKSVTYTAQWEQNTTPPEPPAPVELPFTDVNPGDWFYKDVSYVFENGIMSGFPGDVFLPNKSTTRGMIVTTLWRMEGEPAADFPLTFADVPAGRWFTKAIQWAAANQIVSGYSPQKFGPNDPITREQMATIFYRYASLKQYDVSGRADLSGFSDVDKLSRWAVTPMSWANSAKLIQGVGGNRLSPTGTATRAQAAAILHRFCEQFNA